MGNLALLVIIVGHANVDSLITVLSLSCLSDMGNLALLVITVGHADMDSLITVLSLSCLCRHG